MVLGAAPALATSIPQPCTKADQRVRCVAYSPSQVVQLYAAVGAALTIEFSDAETVADVSASDNGLLEGAARSERQPLVANDQGPATADRNLMMAKRRNYLFLKPLLALLPQPLTVLTKRADGTARRYTFQLETRPGGLTAAVPDTFYTVRFTYPEEAAAARRAAAQAERAARDAARVAARLKQNRNAGPAVRNARYRGQGTAAARAALAPAGSARGPAIWDDGQQTYLRYPGNRRVPMIYQVLQDGQEGVVGQSVAPDPSTHGTLVTLHAVVPMLRLRDGESVLCIVNAGFDATGWNPGTGTTTPDVVRELIPEERRNGR
ncbi:TrbG/VirB9 family P-type conjugative transfer protein [Rhodovastum atsumiense]|nr:TrbG/VirB9 family P-type conjugative transfer protein [Rhodovastum atsumiense]